MTTLSFPDDEALVVALTSGLVPSRVASRPAEHWRDGASHHLRPRVDVDDDALAALDRAGSLSLETEPPRKCRRLGCWAEAVTPRPDPIPDHLDEVLFVCDTTTWLATAAELLRLGCDRQHYMLTDQTALLRVKDPPFYTVARALDGGDALRVFRPVAERLWVALGHQHPLAERHRIPPNRLWLIGSDGTWTRLGAGTWEPIDALVDLELPAGRTPFEPVPPPERIAVSLRLVHTGQPRAPGLWLLRDEPWASMERLLADLPEAAQRGLAFAAGRIDDAEVVLLRARRGAEIAELSLEAERFAAHPALPNLWLPCEASLEPPLGAHKLREITGAGPERMVLLRATGSGVRATEVGVEAFAPLDDWVDYLLHEHADRLAPWIAGTTFELDVLEIAEAAPRERPRAKKSRLAPEPRPLDPPPDGRATRSAASERDEAPASEPPASEAPRSEVPSSVRAIEQRLRRLEQTFFELDAPPDADERLRQWETLAQAYTAIGRHDQAAHGYLRIVWERDEPESWRRWAEAIGTLPLDRLDRLQAPSHADLLRVVCSLASEQPADPAALATFVDAHASSLDARARWLAHREIARRSGGDPLRLSRARDTLLSELRAGLSLDRDVPIFVRAQSTGLSDTVSVAALSTSLAAIREALENGPREPSASEAPLSDTLAYALRILAWAEARLGQGREARRLHEAARALRSDGDEIHALALGMLDARITQAIEGLSPTAPLPGELSGALNELSTFARYKLDRLRQGSRILEPIERLDAMQGFRRAESDPRGEVFAPLRGVDDPQLVAETLGEVMARALGDTCPAGERAHLFGGAMDFFFALPATLAVDWLRAIAARLADIAPFDRALLFEEALVVAAHFGDERLVAQLSDDLRAIIPELGREQSAALAEVLRGALGTLRRVGLRDRAAALMSAVADHAEGDEPELWVARLHLAAGLSYLDQRDRADELVEATLARLAGDVPIKVRLELVRALADATAVEPVDVRRARVARLLDQIAAIVDSFSTNTHFSLSLIHFTESLVHALVPTGPERGGAVAAWLDDDEQRVRWRIHSDLRRLT